MMRSAERHVPLPELTKIRIENDASRLANGRREISARLSAHLCLSCAPPADQKSQRQRDDDARQSAGKRKIHCVAFNRVEHGVLQEIGAIMDCQNTPAPILLDGGGGPPSLEVEPAAIGQFVSLLGAASRDRDGAVVDSSRLIGFGLDVQ